MGFTLKIASLGLGLVWLKDVLRLAILCDSGLLCCFLILLIWLLLGLNLFFDRVCHRLGIEDSLEGPTIIQTSHSLSFKAFLESEMLFVFSMLDN